MIPLFFPGWKIRVSKFCYYKYDGIYCAGAPHWSTKGSQRQPCLSFTNDISPRCHHLYVLVKLQWTLWRKWVHMIYRTCWELMQLGLGCECEIQSQHQQSEKTHSHFSLLIAALHSSRQWFIWGNENEWNRVKGPRCWAASDSSLVATSLQSGFTFTSALAPMAGTGCSSGLAFFLKRRHKMANKILLYFSSSFFFFATWSASPSLFKEERKGLNFLIRSRERKKR